MVDTEFLKYIEEAWKDYNEYKKLEGGIDLSFSDFLLIIIVWKVEAILEGVGKLNE